MATDEEYLGDEIDLDDFTDSHMFFGGSFVPIDNQDMNIADVDYWIKDTRNKNNNVITPEFAMEVLRKTNHCGHLKTVVRNIKERCKTTEEIYPYREFILGCVDKREVSNAICSDLREMAKLARCRDTFDELIDGPKIYSAMDCKLIHVNNSLEYRAVKDKNVAMQTSRNCAEFEGCDFSDFNRCIFRADKVDLWSCKGFSGVLNFSDSYWLNLLGSDLSNVNEIKFRKGADVTLSNTKNLPKVLDVSMCRDVNFSGCDMANVEELRYKNREQEEKFTTRYNYKVVIYNYCKNVVYTDEEKKEKVKVMPKDFGGVEM